MTTVRCDDFHFCVILWNRVRFTICFLYSLYSLFRILSILYSVFSLFSILYLYSSFFISYYLFSIPYYLFLIPLSLLIIPYLWFGLGNIQKFFKHLFWLLGSLPIYRNIFWQLKSCDENRIILQSLQGFPVTGKQKTLLENPVFITGFSCLLHVLSCLTLQCSLKL